MKKYFLGVLLVLTTSIYAQGSSRNGYKIINSGNLSVFFVFADVVNDTNTSTVDGWPEGSLPDFAERLFDYQMNDTLNGFVTRFFNEASFGNLRITGDYYSQLLEINTSSGNGLNEILTLLNGLPGNDIETAHGFHLSDFDKWREKGKYGINSQTPDNLIEIMVVIWRHNSKYKYARDGGNTWSFGQMGRVIKRRGIQNVIFICSDDVSKVLIHEISHLLIGDNGFHTGGAGTGGEGLFLSNIGGYDMLSSFNRNLFYCNGFDRWWLGWKHPDKNYYISAKDLNDNEIETDLVYEDGLQPQEFILRDFATYGDAIRVKLPYLRTFSDNVRNQYVWIENHQMPSSSMESNMNDGHNSPRKGIRINYQIGDDQMEGNGLSILFSSKSNYFVPLSSFGNYDFYYDTNDVPSGYRAKTYSQCQNPFTGDHPLMLPAFDYTEDDSITSSENITVWSIYRNDILEMDKFPVFGNKYDIFPVGSRISIASNPSLSSLINYSTAIRPHKKYVHTPRGSDNRYVWLNGLHIDIVEQYPDGSIKIRIIWDDYSVDRNVRWCGPIMLSEQLNLKPACCMTLDYGTTVTRPANPMIFNNKKVFSDPTTFTCRYGSHFLQESGSTVNVINNSTLVIDSGAFYEIEDLAVLNIEQSGTLIVRSGGTLRVKGAGHVEVKNGAYVCIEKGAKILLDHVLGKVNLRPGFITGINPAGSSGVTCDCAMPPTGINVVGNGSINDDFLDACCFQNVDYDEDTYKSCDSIRAGYDECDIPVGNVRVLHGARVIFDSEKGTYLKNGIEVELGSSLEIR